MKAVVNNPIRFFDKVQWDCVWFGNYPQSDVSGERKEPIKWRVLHVDGNDAFLLADQCLDARPFNYDDHEDVTWETCFLRGWLNGEFLDQAFSAQEQSAIIPTTVKTEFTYPSGAKRILRTTDQVFLLSIDDVTNPAYGFSEAGIDEARKATHTVYSEHGPDQTMEYSMDWWWLRTSALNSISISASLVREDGLAGVNAYSADDPGFKARPALHLDLSSSVWTHAGVLHVEVNGVMDDKEASSRYRKSFANKILRTRAVKELKQQKMLALIAKGDESPDIRRIAAGKLYDRESLRYIAGHDEDPGVRQAALDMLGDQETLIDRALRGDGLTVRYNAVKRITDTDTLIHVALHEHYWQIRRTAVERLFDRETLIYVASNDCNESVRDAAKERLVKIGDQG